ncbi:hypothetical protein [Kutzneria albida]|uniref:Uncharacterized protein n=1 Tax=Kutzneria albida DSM 43870 TaxID=1449976 RepID=W5WJF7_9PSEU|nr:hypothetical protein [Kutzneria albida]AHI00697.1 hypothetical protein KALB_7339 [Kutzneria albida DSM 43870]
MALQKAVPLSDHCVKKSLLVVVGAGAGGGAGAGTGRFGPVGRPGCPGRSAAGGGAATVPPPGVGCPALVGVGAWLSTGLVVTTVGQGLSGIAIAVGTPGAGRGACWGCWGISALTITVNTLTPSAQDTPNTASGDIRKGARDLRAGLTVRYTKSRCLP